MLSESFTQRFAQIMNLKQREINIEGKARFSKRSAELASRGLSTPHVLPMIHHEIATWKANRRIECAIEAIKLLNSSGHESDFTETWATELKQLVESWATDTWCKQSIDAYGLVTNEQRAKYEIDLFQKRNGELTRANLEIDLLSDSARSKVGQPQQHPKELDQKFKILWSPEQARIDFEGWAKALEPTGVSIAILFIDIDHFKTFNTKHTETVIDQTLLPDTMRLIQRQTIHRGGAYRQGGEEFLIILPNHDLNESTAFAEKLRSAFETTTFIVREETERMTISIGVALWPQHGHNYQDVLEKANQGKAEAKKTRNTVAIFH